MPIIFAKFILVSVIIFDLSSCNVAQNTSSQTLGKKGAFQ